MDVSSKQYTFCKSNKKFSKNNSDKNSDKRLANNVYAAWVDHAQSVSQRIFRKNIQYSEQSTLASQPAPQFALAVISAQRAATTSAQKDCVSLLPRTLIRSEIKHRSIFIQNTQFS